MMTPVTCADLPTTVLRPQAGSTRIRDHKRKECLSLPLLVVLRRFH